MEKVKHMAKTATEYQKKIAELERKLAATEQETGKIWPDVSKAVKSGEKATGIMTLRGVHAKPQYTINMYPSQFARLLPQIPTIIHSMLKPELWEKFSFRSDDEKAKTKAVLEAYNAEASSD